MLHKEEIWFLVEGNKWSFMGTFTLGCCAQRQGSSVLPKPAESAAWNGNQLTLDRRVENVRPWKTFFAWGAQTLQEERVTQSRLQAGSHAVWSQGPAYFRSARVNGCLLPFPWRGRFVSAARGDGSWGGGRGQRSRIEAQDGVRSLGEWWEQDETVVPHCVFSPQSSQPVKTFITVSLHVVNPKGLCWCLILRGRVC